jgi:hypothetical protein
MRPASLSETSRSHGLGEFARWLIGRSTGAELPNRDAKLLCLVGEVVLNPGTREMQHDKAEPFPLSDMARIGVSFLFWVYRSSAEYTGSAIDS